MSIWIQLVSYLVRAVFFRQAIRRAKRSGFLIYLKSLQVIRKSLIGAVLLFSMLQLMIFSFVGAIVATVFLTPTELETKLWILFGVFAGFFLIAMTLMFVLLSEKMWFRFSGAQEMVENMPDQDAA